MSEDSENEQKNEAQSTNTEDKSQEQQDSSKQQQPTPKKAPMVGRPIGTPPPPRPAATPAEKPVAPAVSQPATTPVSKPVGTPVGAPRVTVGTPVGAPRPSVGTPVGTPRPTVGTPVGTPRPAVGTPVGAPRPSVGSPAARPAVGTTQSAASVPTAPKTPPSKPVESKVERSRRNFIKGLAIVGGLAVVASYVPLFPYLDGSVGAGAASPELQLVQNPNLPKNQLVPITPADVDPANGTVFQYPYNVGDSNTNSDSFVQCVLIQLPQGFSGEGYSVQDPKTGKNYIAFSRVCVHLWCLWSYNINDPRGPVGACPCHGSTYVPGSGNYPITPSFSNQAPGTAVAGPASLQTAPNNMLPIIQLKIAADGSFHAIGRVGSVGCGQKC